MEHIRASNLLSIQKKYLIEKILPAVQSLNVAHTPRVHTYQIHAETFRLEFFSSVLEQRFTKALAHLEIPSSNDSDLTVTLWDGSTQEVVSPLVSDEYFLQSEVDARGTSHDGFLGTYIHGEESVTLYDLEKQQAYYYVSDAEALPHWVDAAPLRALLHWFLANYSLQLIHGAVIGYQGRGILLTAPGGSGKSTTAVNCVRHGMQYLGDDYVAITKQEPITAYSLYSSAKLTQNAMDHFPSFVHEAVVESGMEKAVLHIHELFSTQLVRELPIDAVFVPRIHAGEQTYIEEAKKADVVRAIVPTTLLQLPLARKDIFSDMCSIVEKLPCYVLMLGSDREAVPGVIMSFMKRAVE